MLFVMHNHSEVEDLSEEDMRNRFIQKTLQFAAVWIDLLHVKVIIPADAIR